MRFPTARTVFPLAPVVAIAIAGCHSNTQTVRGVAPTQGKFVTVSSVTAGPTLRLKGTMVEKCPVAGCWFMLRDKTGEIKVDTKNAGFVVSDVPVNTVITVQGRELKAGDSSVAASGISF